MKSSLNFEDVKQLINFVQNLNNNNLLCNKAIGKLGNCFLDSQIRIQMKNYDISGFLFNIYKERGNDEDIAIQLVRALANLCVDKTFIDSIIDQRPGKIFRNMADRSTNVSGLNNCLRLIKKLTNYNEVLNKLIYSEDIINTLIIFLNKTYLYSVAAQSQKSESFIEENHFKFTDENEQEMALKNIVDLLSFLLNAFYKFQNQNRSKRFSKFNVLNCDSEEIDFNELYEDFTETYDDFTETYDDFTPEDKSKDEVLNQISIKSPQLKLAYDLKFLESILDTQTINQSTYVDKPPPVAKLIISLLKVNTINHLFSSLGAVKVMLVLLRQNVFDENNEIIVDRVDSPKAIYLTQSLYLLSRERYNRVTIRDLGGLRLLSCMADNLASTFCQNNRAPNCTSYCLTVIISCLTNFSYDQTSMVSLGDYELLEILNKTLLGYLLWSAVGGCKDETTTQPVKSLGNLVNLATNTEELPLIKTCQNKDILVEEDEDHQADIALPLAPDSVLLSPLPYEQFRELEDSPIYAPPSPSYPYYSPRGKLSPSSSSYSNCTRCGAEWEDDRMASSYYSSEEESVEHVKQLPISPPRSAAQSPIKAKNNAKTSIDKSTSSIPQYGASTSKDDFLCNENVSCDNTSILEADCPICCAKKSLTSGLQYRLLGNIFSLILQIFRFYHYNPSSLFTQHHGILTTMLDVFRCSRTPHRKLIQALNRVSKSDRLFDILFKYKFPLFVYKTLVIFWSQNPSSTMLTNSKLSSPEHSSPPRSYCIQRTWLKTSDCDLSIAHTPHPESLAKDDDPKSQQCSSCCLKVRFLEKLMRNLQKISMTSFALCVIDEYVFERLSDGSPGNLTSEQAEAALLSLPLLFINEKYRLCQMLQISPYLTLLRSKINLVFQSQDGDLPKARAQLEDVMLGLHYLFNLTPSTHPEPHTTQKYHKTNDEFMIFFSQPYSPTEKIIKLYPDKIYAPLQLGSHVRVPLALLQNQSPVFAAMFNEHGNFRESNTDSLNVVGSDIREIELLFDLMCEAETASLRQDEIIENTIEHHLSCYSLCHRYMMKGVEERLRTKILPSFILKTRPSKINDPEIRDHNDGESAFTDMYIYLASNNFAEASQKLCETYVQNLPRTLHRVKISNLSISNYQLIDTELAEIAQSGTFANLVSDTLAIYEKYIADLYP